MMADSTVYGLYIVLFITTSKLAHGVSSLKVIIAAIVTDVVIDAMLNKFDGVGVEFERAVEAISGGIGKEGVARPNSLTMWIDSVPAEENGKD